MRYHKLISQITFFGILVSLVVGCNPLNPLWTIFTEERAAQLGIGSWVATDTEFDGYWTPQKKISKRLKVN